MIPKFNMDTSLSSGGAPALERGLMILEILATANRPVGFREIAQALALTSASTVRLLKVLCAREYVIKEELSGKYGLGPKMLAFRRPTPLVDRMREEAMPLLRALNESCANTVLLIHWTGKHMVCLAKIVHPASIVMQDVGAIDLDLSHAPWGWLFYHALDDNARQASLADMVDATAFLQQSRNELAYYRKHGFTYDNQTYFDHVRRLASPVFDAMGQCIGAIALGGNPLTIPDERITPYGLALVEGANLLSQRLGYSCATPHSTTA